MSSKGQASPIKGVDTWHGSRPELAELRGVGRGHSGLYPQLKILGGPACSIEVQRHRVIHGHELVCVRGRKKKKKRETATCPSREVHESNLCFFHSVIVLHVLAWQKLMTCIFMYRLCLLHQTCQAECLVSYRITILVLHPATAPQMALHARVEGSICPLVEQNGKCFNCGMEGHQAVVCKTSK